jgi:hypothetical protein
LGSEFDKESECLDFLSFELNNNLQCFFKLPDWQDIAVLAGLRYIKMPAKLIQQGSYCTSFAQEPLYIYYSMGFSLTNRFTSIGLTNIVAKLAYVYSKDV